MTFSFLLTNDFLLCHISKVLYATVLFIFVFIFVILPPKICFANFNIRKIYISFLSLLCQSLLLAVRISLMFLYTNFWTWCPLKRKDRSVPPRFLNPKGEESKIDTLCKRKNDNSKLCEQAFFYCFSVHGKFSIRSRILDTCYLGV